MTRQLSPSAGLAGEQIVRECPAPAVPPAGAGFLPDWFMELLMPEPNSGCVIWMGTLTPEGYGMARRPILGHRFAHRIAYAAAFGPIPAGKQLDHKCRVRCCCNPFHVEPVTARENLLRSPITLAGINAIKTHCPQGHEYAAQRQGSYYRSNGWRRCQVCHREREATRQALYRRRDT